MAAFWIDRLNESDGRLHKEDVVRQALELAQLGSHPAQVFLGLAVATYNPLVTWGVKQVPSTNGITEAENPWSDFNTMLGDLHHRRLTGGAAKNAIQEMSGRFTSHEWNTVCAAVLRKDLRAGISEKTINKITRGTQWQVPVFSCQLATSCDSRPEMTGVKRLEPKLDGVRVLMVCTVGQDISTAVSYSRNGKIFENFTAIESSIIDNLHKIAGLTGHTSFVLDGEVVGNSFQELMRQARRKEGADASDSVFHIFDFVPLNDFVKGLCRANLDLRLGYLKKIEGVLGTTTNVKLLPSILVDLDTAAGADQFRRYCNDMVASGFEGVMIKDLDAPYECKRTTHWLKYKPVTTVDLEVVDVEEGTGRNVGRLGALVCAGNDGGRDIQVNVGSGFSDVERDSFWVDRSLVIGRTVEIMCDVITQNQDGTYSLRFPRFVRFRDDK